jgi:RimJ/RimL family protein N-acetyltransferase
LGHRRARWGRPPNAASVRVLEKIGMRLVDSYFDEDGQRDIYRR